MALPLLDRVDAAVGDGIERAMTHHHLRRLRRQGHVNAIAPASDSLWAQTAVPPRDGNSFEVLIDGENALPAMAEAIRNAQRHVHVASWNLEPSFDPGPRTSSPVRDLLAETAERIPVRVLVWAGAPVPVFQPRRGVVKEARDRLIKGSKVQCELDARGRKLHCHHEKLVIVDDEIAFVGGIDLTSLAGDRYDSCEHPHKPDGIGWHDASSKLRGPIVRDVAAHFAMRWEAIAHEALELPEGIGPAGDVTAQFTRTVPEHAYDVLPRGEFSILESYIRALRSARQLIYLENQFLWSPEIVRILEGKLRNPPTPGFRVVVLLPHKANNGQDDTRGMLGRLVAADHDDRFLAATIMSRTGERSGPLYVHAKIGIVDDKWLAIGSANLNEHSLFNDSEVDVVTHDARLARATRLRLWEEHLETTPHEDSAMSVDEQWRPIASEQLDRRRTGAPLTHHLVALPGVSRRSRRLIGPLDALVVDG
ncbi:phospholipase D-like domain-containing protein [Solirubrobacter soli]|uniref:phospholipase D-like domain-containing protein n=1 Tax=Solirubrobacter soli TaxID=363832 RepID=UPI00040E02E4|nr:phosphatidylserine/phosphatidylglycerophosphate/cardiolipin synthase family protein [Solirubrobacter soli]